LEVESHVHVHVQLLLSAVPAVHVHLLFVACDSSGLCVESADTVCLEGSTHCGHMLSGVLSETESGAGSRADSWIVPQRKREMTRARHSALVRRRTCDCAAVAMFPPCPQVLKAP
jgi:hypothetical protein